MAEDADEGLDHPVGGDADKDDEENGVGPGGILSRLLVDARDGHRRSERVAPVVQGPQLKQRQQRLSILMFIASACLWSEDVKSIHLCSGVWVP